MHLSIQAACAQLRKLSSREHNAATSAVSNREACVHKPACAHYHKLSSMHNAASWAVSDKNSFMQTSACGNTAPQAVSHA